MYALIYKMIDINKNVSNRPEHVDFLRRLLREGKDHRRMEIPRIRTGPASRGLDLQSTVKERGRVMVYTGSDHLVSCENLRSATC